MDSQHSIDSDMCTLFRDNTGLLEMTDEAMHELRPSDANQGQEGYSLPHHMTDGHWFGRASVPDVADVVVNNSLDLGIEWSELCMTSLSSSGSLVCSQPAVSALPLAESYGGLLHTHGAYPLDHSSCASQALGRDCHSTHVSEGLVSASNPNIA